MYVRPRMRVRPRNGQNNGSSNPFLQDGPTLDLVFAAPSSSGFVANNDSIDLNFVGQTYEVAAQYMVWE
jgi:hypothetical protein